MPRYVAYRNEETLRRFNSDHNGGPASNNRPLRNRYPDGFDLEGKIPKDSVPLHRFDAPDEPDAAHAWRYFRKLQETGCPADITKIGDAGFGSGGGTLWRYRGDVGHLVRLGARMGLPDHAAKGIQGDPRFRKVTDHLNDLNEMYFKCRKEGGVAILASWQRPSVEEWLKRCEQAILEAGLLACAMAEAVDGARDAFGFPRDRCFSVVIDSPAEAAPVVVSAPTDPIEESPQESATPESQPELPHNKRQSPRAK